MKRKRIAMVFAWAGLFTASSIAATVPGLVLHYTFDEALNSTTAADSSGNGYERVNLRTQSLPAPNKLFVRPAVHALGGLN